MGVEAGQSILREFWEIFSFKVPNYQFMPAAKRRYWDGTIRLFNLKSRKIYKGLVPYIEKYCKKNNYDFISELNEYDNVISSNEVDEFLKTLKLPEYIQPRQYQIDSIAHCIKKQRAVNLLSTGSGKSICIYSLCRYFNDKKTLIVVPTKALVTQMYSDFENYSQNDDTWNVDEQCSQIMGGYEKHNLNNVVISTWQSIYELPKDWFEEYEMVIVDEVHEAKAKSITSIMEKLENAHLRLVLQAR